MMREFAALSMSEALIRAAEGDGLTIRGNECRRQLAGPHNPMQQVVPA
jgi:hypothetical protein